MKKILFSCTLAIALLGIFPIPASAQVFMPGRFYNPYGMYAPSSLYNVPFVSYSSRGNLFLEKDWRVGKVELKDGKVVEGFPLKYDIEHHRMEVLVEEEVKVLTLKQIKAFEWIDPETDYISHFVNGFDYSFDGVPLVGVFQVLVNGYAKLFLKVDVDTYRSSYSNGYFATSVRVEERVKRSDNFYMALGNEIFPIEKSAKYNWDLFGDKAGEMQDYVKENKLKFKKGEDLVKIFGYFNSII